MKDTLSKSKLLAKRQTIEKKLPTTTILHFIKLNQLSCYKRFLVLPFSGTKTKVSFKYQTCYASIWILLVNVQNRHK